MSSVLNFAVLTPSEQIGYCASKPQQGSCLQFSDQDQITYNNRFEPGSNLIKRTIKYLIAFHYDKKSVRDVTHSEKVDVAKTHT